MKRIARLWKVALVAVAGLVLASGCAGGGEGDTGTVDWWTISSADSELGMVWARLGEDFHTQHPDRAGVRITPHENDAFKTALATALREGNPPDLLQTWGGGVLGAQVAAEQVRDLTDELAGVIETIAPGALAPYVVDGRVYGLPYNAGMVGFWYNTELFEEAGVAQPPRTWRELLDVVRQLQDAGITPIALGGADKWPGHFWWSYLALRIAGLDAFVRAGETGSFDHPGFVAAGERLRELVAMEPFQDGFATVGYEGEDGQAATMGRGEAAMELMGQWAPAGMVDWAGLSGADADEVLATRQFFPFPEVAGGAGSRTEVFGGGAGFAVSADASADTIDFLRHIFDQDSFAAVTATAGNVPVLAGGEDMLSNPALRPLLDQLAVATGFQLYLDQEFPEAVGTQVNDSTAALIAGEISPEEVVSSVNQVWSLERD